MPPPPGGKREGCHPAGSEQVQGSQEGRPIPPSTPGRSSPGRSADSLSHASKAPSVRWHDQFDV